MPQELYRPSVGVSEHRIGHVRWRWGSSSVVGRWAAAMNVRRVCGRPPRVGHGGCFGFHELLGEEATSPVWRDARYPRGRPSAAAGSCFSACPTRSDRRAHFCPSPGPLCQELLDELEGSVSRPLDLGAALLMLLERTDKDALG